MKRILTLGLVALGIMTQAQEKILVSTGYNGNKHYIYPSTIRKSDYGITVWSKSIYAKPKLLEGTKKYFTSSKAQHLVDCDGMRYTLISFVSYSKNGNIVDNTSISEYEAYSYSELEPAAPGTVAWRIIEETCSRY